MTALQAIVWHALRACGVNDRIEGYGRLFREILADGSGRASRTRQRT